MFRYVHSMYLALLAGGQIMKRIVKKTLGVSGDCGLDLFEFKTVDRTELRQQIKTLIDNLELSIEEKDSIVKEKLHIFHMNNMIAGNIKVTWANYWRLIQFIVIVAVVLLSCCLLIWSRV